MKETRALLRELRKGGFTVETTGGRHYRVISPHGQKAFLPRTPSDSRALKNALADLKRIGFTPGARKKQSS